MTATKSTPDTGPLVADIIAQMRFGVRELRCVASQRMHAAGVSAGHFHLTSMIDRHGPMPMSRISELLDVSMSAVTGIVDRLEERHLVERVRVPDDRRVVLVKLTDQGRQTLQDVEVLQEAMLEKILGRLEPARLAALAGVLDDLRRVIGELSMTEPDLFAHHHPAHDDVASGRRNQED